jgi:hypothetical protein
MSGDRDRPTRAERYECATSTSDLTLRHSDFPPGAPDILAAMAWSKKQLGTELIRLASQWDRERPARPRPRSVAQFIAMGMPRDRARLEASREKHELAGAYYRAVLATFAQAARSAGDRIAADPARGDLGHGGRRREGSGGAALLARSGVQGVRGPRLAPHRRHQPGLAPTVPGVPGQRATLPPYGEDGRRLATYLDECKRGG